MFLRPENNEKFKIEWTVISAPNFHANPKEDGIDNDGELNNDPTIVKTAELEATKAGNIIDVNSNGEGIDENGDVIEEGQQITVKTGSQHHKEN